MREFKLIHEPDATIGMNVRKINKVCSTEEISGQDAIPCEQGVNTQHLRVEAGGGDSK